MRLARHFGRKRPNHPVVHSGTSAVPANAYTNAAAATYTNAAAQLYTRG